MKSKEWQEIKDVFAAAFDLSDDERIAFLSHARPDIRREVEKLLPQTMKRKISSPSLLLCNWGSMTKSKPILTSAAK